MDDMVTSPRISKWVFVGLVAILSLPTAYGQTVAPVPAVFAGRVRLALPANLYAAVNVETNVFFDNVILAQNSANYVFDVKCEKGMVLADRWTYTPAPEDAGAYPLTLEVRDEQNGVIARASSTLHVAGPDAAATASATLLAVGDSLTQASIYTQRLLELSETGNGFALKLIGSRGPDNSAAHGANRHEGYSGWTAQAFATFTGPLSRSGQFKGRETGSPFVYVEGDKPRLDFGRYCGQFNGGQAPDFVTFALGTNDIFYGTDEKVDSIIDQMLVYLDQLVAMVHQYSTSTNVGILLVIPPAASQDGFRNYRGSQRQTRWQYRRDQHRLIERLIDHYGGREKENLYLVPTYLNLDSAHNFVVRPLAWNSENPEEAPRVIDGIHPAPAGYRQMGDTIYSWIKVTMAAKSK